MKVVVERIANVLEEFEATGERMKDATVQKNSPLKVLMVKLY